MASRNLSNNNSKLINVVCAVLFVLFTFCYLYFYQADVIAAAQHVFSGGQTRYDRLIGAVLITVGLFFLHLVFLGITRLTYRAHAITFYPSLLALLVLTSVRISGSNQGSFGPWLWLAPLLLAVVCFVAYLVRKYEVFEKVRKPVGIFSKVFWSNVLLLCFGFFFVGFFANNDDVFHYRMRTESLLLKRDYEGALRVGQKSLATDSSLTLLRIHALAKSHQMGERLFEYPLVGGSQVLIPNGKTALTVMYPNDKFVPVPQGDFVLCSYLLDRKIDAFAIKVKRYYDLDSSLPKHYREALVLYNHLRSNPVVAYKHEVAETDFADFQKLMRECGRNKARLCDVYGNTYWYYYYEK